MHSSADVNPEPPQRQPVDYASPARAAPPRAAAWVVVAAITLTACAMTFGLVYWLMDQPPRRPRGRVWVPAPMTTQAVPFPQISPGAGPVQQAPLAPGRAEVARCAMRLQRIAAALQAWANGHHWQLPDRLEDLVGAGLLDRGDLVCPAGEVGSGGGSASGADSTAYRYVGSGLKTPVPSDVVVVYEPPLHAGGLGMNVLFGDGGVRLLTGDDASRLSAQAEAGGTRLRYSPTTTPSGER